MGEGRREVTSNWTPHITACPNPKKTILSSAWERDGRRSSRGDLQKRTPPIHLPNPNPKPQPQQLTVSVAKKDAVLRMAELGWLYRRVQSFADLGARRIEDMGLVGQAFCVIVQVRG